MPLNFKVMLLSARYARERYNGRLYAKAQNLRPVIVRQYRDAFADVDLLAMPTVPVRAHPYDEPGDYVEAFDRTLFGGELGDDLALIIHNTAPFNYTGFPSISVPCAGVAGMPVGLQLTAPFFREDELIRAAHAYQESVDLGELLPEAKPRLSGGPRPLPSAPVPGLAGAGFAGARTRPRTRPRPRPRTIRAPPSPGHGDTRPRAPRRGTPPRDSAPRTGARPTGTARAGGTPGEG